MKDRKPPKYHTLKRIYLFNGHIFDGMTIDEAKAVINNIDTSSLIDPILETGDEYDYYDVSLYVTGFVPMTEAERAKVDKANKLRKEAAKKRDEKKAEQEKQLLKKLASKYPDALHNS